MDKGKTEVMLFGTTIRRNKEDRDILIEYESKPVNVTKKYKYLRISLDPSLNMTEHFNTTTGCARKKFPCLS